MDLTIAIDKRDGYILIKCGGDLATHNCGKLRSNVASLIDEGCVKVVIDLCGVEYVDSTGLASLVGILKRLTDHNGRMAIVANTPQIVRVFEITVLKDLLCMRDNLPDAVNLVTNKSKQLA